MSLQSPKTVPTFLPHNSFQDRLNLKESDLPNCVRCKESIVSGNAYELGDDRWHTDCFTCYRCGRFLNCDSDFLVLGTGALICFDCSDSCKRCGKKIDDLAIILSSSNEAYCSECFVCCKCGENIKDLRYARTRKGLFCLKCHKKLLAKRRLYEEKKRREMKNLPILPEPLENNPLSTTTHESNATSPSKNKTSSVQDISIHDSLNAENNRNNSVPKQKVLLNKTPLKNYEKKPELIINDEDEGFYSKVDKKHKKELSLPLLDADQKLSLTPAKQITQANDSSKKHLKSYSDVTEFINKSPLLENRNNIYDENTFTKTPLNLLSLPTETPTTDTFKNSVEQQPLTPKRLSANNEVIHEQDLGDKSECLTRNDTYTYNTTTSETNDILNNYIDRSSLLSERMSFNLSGLLDNNNDNNEIKKKFIILQQLEDDIIELQATKAKLLQQVENMIIIKRDLENKLDIMKEEINSAQHILNEYSQQPQLPAGSSESFPNDNVPIKNESTVSVSRPTTKPKFWKIFSSKTQTSPSIISSPLPYSYSNQNISHLRNLPSPQMFNNSNLKSSPSHSTIDKTRQKIEISPPMLQHPEDLQNINLIPISNNNNKGLPVILTKCIQYIESNEENLKSEGLYRKSGSKRVIEEIEAQFKSGEKNIDLSLYDINAITSVLKKYLRDLPNPIITYEIYESVIDYVRENGMNLQDMATKQGFRQILKSLPKDHIEILKLLSKHINLVQHYSEFNLMTAKNLHLVFTPSLIRDYSGEKEIIDLKERNFIIGYIFEHCQELFD